MFHQKLNIFDLRRKDGTIVTDDHLKAELLRNHFESSYPSDEEVNVRNANVDPGAVPSPDVTLLNNIDISTMNILKHLRKLSNLHAVSLDGLTSAFLKRCDFEICEPLSIILERSIQDARVPKLFKQAIVRAVHKKGCKTRVKKEQQRERLPHLPVQQIV